MQANTHTTANGFSSFLKALDYGFRYFLSILGGDSDPSYHEDDHELA